MKSKIDGFAMNMAFMDSTNEAQLPVAFEVARKLGFKLFFSFDYAANGIWSYDAVLKLIQVWSKDPAYFRDRVTNRPLVSTFEGPVAEKDWKKIKDLTNCFFVPSWNSRTPADVMSKGLANGLFNWDAWPEGNKEMVSFHFVNFVPCWLSENGTVFKALLSSFTGSIYMHVCRDFEMMLNLLF